MSFIDNNNNKPGGGDGSPHVLLTATSQDPLSRILCPLSNFFPPATTPRPCSPAHCISEPKTPSCLTQSRIFQVCRFERTTQTSTPHPEQTHPRGDSSSGGSTANLSGAAPRYPPRSRIKD
ncbi:hypothetical protein NKR23_g682 [Pleurostoma richardsiae]|uniref:Uncharacterized protein n=1 Tax=Pleurostoma richardsiae TaxID=41990 RepID=A0AA38RVI9_9PEZI|nr:hypothetical protein NKR23_g682 [Pleurostoma richardsiae]